MEAIEALEAGISEQIYLQTLGDYWLALRG
jgi:hypothetical protein